MLIKDGMVSGVFRIIDKLIAKNVEAESIKVTNGLKVYQDATKTNPRLNVSSTRVDILKTDGGDSVAKFTSSSTQIKSDEIKLRSNKFSISAFSSVVFNADANKEVTVGNQYNDLFLKSNHFTEVTTEDDNYNAEIRLKAPRLRVPTILYPTSDIQDGQDATGNGGSMVITNSIGCNPSYPRSFRNVIGFGGPDNTFVGSCIRDNITSAGEINQQDIRGLYINRESGFISLQGIDGDRFGIGFLDIAMTTQYILEGRSDRVKIRCAKSNDAKVNGVTYIEMHNDGTKTNILNFAANNYFFYAEDELDPYASFHTIGQKYVDFHDSTILADNWNIDSDGNANFTSLNGTPLPSNISLEAYELPDASEETVGGVYVSDSLDNSNDGYVPGETKTVVEKSIIESKFAEIFGNVDENGNNDHEEIVSLNTESQNTMQIIYSGRSVSFSIQGAVINTSIDNVIYNGIIRENYIPSVNKTKYATVNESGDLRLKITITTTGEISITICNSPEISETEIFMDEVFIV